jgi:hypothetical protein
MKIGEEQKKTRIIPQNQILGEQQMEYSLERKVEKMPMS